ncbi:uroporphyrinogen decarboxylase family protein, partial [Acinetobacter baumannii]
HVFNLGHGLSPDMDPEHVGALVRAVHELSARALTPTSLPQAGEGRCQRAHPNPSSSPPQRGGRSSAREPAARKRASSPRRRERGFNSA